MAKVEVLGICTCGEIVFQTSCIVLLNNNIEFTEGTTVISFKADVIVW